MPPLRTLLAASLLLPAALPAQAQDFIFPDGFEPLRAHRIDTLVLRDPHLFAQVIGCNDITALVNAQIDTGLSGDSDGDGLLDNSPMLLFRPLDTDGSRGLGQTGTARCTAPAAGTSCQSADPPALAALPYAGQAIGTCLAPVPGTVRPYSPPVTAPAGPCFASDPAAGGGAGLPLPLTAIRSAATRRENPTAGLADGLLYGFVTEAAADALVLELPGLGPRTLSSLLAGGTGACPAYSDMDVHEGQDGWWFYFNYTATVVPYAE
jgi:hypothetical protein